MSGGICRNYAFVQPEDYLSIYVRFSPKRNCSRCETSTSIPSSWEQRNTWTVAIPGSEQATRWDSFTARSTEDMKRRARGSPCLRGERTQGRPCVAAPASALLLAAWAQHGSSLRADGFTPSELSGDCPFLGRLNEGVEYRAGRVERNAETPTGTLVRRVCKCGPCV